MLGVGRLGPLGRDEAVEVGGASARGAARDVRDVPGFEETDEAERDAWVVLSGVAGVGPVTFARLLAEFGCAREVLDAARGPRAVGRLVAATAAHDGGVPSLGPGAASGLVTAARDPSPWLVPVRRSGVRVLTLADEAYPRRLRRIDLPPPVLFLHGDPAALDRPRSVAIVGTRRPTGVGRATSGRIADAIGSLGATIVSGLALGIDAVAHASAVRLGTPTVAVLGGGHERLYPGAHRGLARAIVAGGGAVVSEFSPDTQPTRGTFPRRNRLISGLADATVVVEAGVRSGALTTAAWALEQGRGLHLVPGRLDDPAVAGCLAFLREAGPEARVVAGIPELLQDLGLVDAGAGDRVDDGRRVAAGSGSGGAGQASTVAVLAVLGPVERAVARAIAEGRGSVDELVARTGEPGATVLAALTALEIRGLVLEIYGRYRAAGVLAAGIRAA
jgi:DNA processing protein